MRPALVVLLVVSLGLGVFLGRQIVAGRAPSPESNGSNDVQEGGEELPSITGNLSRFPAAGNAPLPIGGDALLARVLDQVGNDFTAPGFHGLASITKAQFLADMIHNQAPFATVNEALVAMLQPARAKEVRACMQAAMASGDLPGDYLTRPMVSKASLWDPIGRAYLEEAFFGEARADFSRAMLLFQRRLEVRMLVGQHRKALFANPALVQEQATLADVAALNEIFDRHEGPIRERIRAESLFQAYVEAIDTEVATGNYEALPNGIDASYLARCRQDENRRRIIDIQVAVSGWDGCLIVYEGAHPPLDTLLNEIEALRAARDAELEQLILAMR